MNWLKRASVIKYIQKISDSDDFHSWVHISQYKFSSIQIVTKLIFLPPNVVK